MRKAFAVLLCVASLSTASLASPPPDKTAWQVFLKLTAPTPGLKAVAFETWASDSDLFSPKPHWPGLPHNVLLRSLAAAAADHAVAGLAPQATDSCYPRGGEAGNFPKAPPADACIGEEVMHNRPIFDAIRAANLFSRAGLAQNFLHTKPIRFPGDSIVVKADWILVSDILRWLPNAYKNADQVRGAYYTNTATFNGKRGEYALAGMSVQSRQQDDWVWSTFEQRSNPGRCDVIGCHDAFGATLANVAPQPGTNSDYGACVKSPVLAALFARAGLDAVWGNYCLKGTQTRFVTGSGQPTILANSVIERMNKGVAVEQTSCITCHAYASFDRSGVGNFAVLQKPPPPTGAVHKELLNGFKTYDYMWGLLAAH